MSDFTFDLDQDVTVTPSEKSAVPEDMHGEPFPGKIIGRQDALIGDDQYRVEYPSGIGTNKQVWFSAGDIQASK